MADEYLQQLTEDTAPVASNFVPISDSGTGRLKKLKYSRVNLEHQTSTPDANITGEVGVLDIITMTSMTANRDYILPSTAAVGECCGVLIVDGDDTYGVLLKSGAAGDKINNVDHSSTEWTTLNAAGEKVTFRCIDAAGPHWNVDTDSRVGAAGSGATTATASTTDATVTTCGTIATATDTAYTIKATIIGRNTTDSSQAFGYTRTATFLNDGGTLTLVGSVTTDHQGETADGDATLDASGTDIRCRVTGIAATNIDWFVSLEVIEV